MIKIINNPNPKTVDTWKTTCDECQCEFTYQREDVTDDWNGVVGPGSFGCLHVFCPNCGERVYAPMTENQLVTGEDDTITLDEIIPDEVGFEDLHNVKVVKLTPEEIERFNEAQYVNGWKDLGNGLKMDRNGRIAGGLKLK
jgi:hypothetical protein